MKLRGRFIAWFALAALVPIAASAVITREVVAGGYQDEYTQARADAERTVRREVGRLTAQVDAAVAALASRDNPFVGGLLSQLVIGSGRLSDDAQRVIKEQAGPVMRGLSLDVLVVAGAGDTVLVAPHYRAAVGDVDPNARTRARTGGGTFFTRDKILTGPTVEAVVVAEAARLARDRGQEVAVMAGRRVGEDLLATVRRRDRVDARVVEASGVVVVPAADASWSGWRDGAPIRIPLRDVDGAELAWVELAVSDRGLDQVLFRVTLVAGVLAALSLGLAVLVAVLVSRRMTRDLDRLVAGSLAASRGELEHRVPVASRDEIGEVGAAFNYMMEDLRLAKERLVIAERIAAWQEIARRLAHEIKNPLTPIQMAMDTLRKTWRKKHPSFDEILEESTQTVLEEADRLKRIVSEFSDFARMPKPDFQRVDLGELVSSALALYQGAVPIERALAAGLPAIDADRGQLSQVLLNLVENARDALAAAAADAGGAASAPRIVVSTRPGDGADRVALVVEDNGPGVPSERKDKVFAPYFTTKQARGGTGLGLAIVHRIVSDHGGRISVGDAPGGGARFTIELPLRQGEPLLASRL
ncbi:MAG: HAMP domain-containing protein [Kofleriaceae bacterium]|nr:HAMP domain-containing protein [Kofleriaceae bacterium]